MADIQSVTAEIRRGEKERKKIELECGSMPNVMVVLPSAEYRWRPLFNAAKFR